MKHSVNQHTLKSGTKGLTVHIPDCDIFRITVRFNSGYQFANPKIYELPHLLEHLMGCGSKKYPAPNEFNIQVERNGAGHNAYTSANINGYYIECARFERDRILGLLEEYLVNPLIPEEAIATEKSNVCEELTRNTANNAGVCWINLFEQIYPNEYQNYEQRIKNVGQISREDITTYYKQTHTARNARFYAVGDMPDGGAAVAKRLERIFAKLEPGTRYELAHNVAKKLDRPIVTKRDIKTIYYDIAAFGSGVDRQDRNAFVLFRLLLGVGFASRIYGEARRRGLAYHLNIVVSASSFDSSVGFNGYVSSENIDALMALYRIEIQRILKGDISESELEAACNLGVGSTQRGTQAPSDILSWYMTPYDSEEYIRDFDGYLEGLRKTTPDDIVQMLKRVIAGQNFSSSFLGDISDEDTEKYYKAANSIWTS